MWIVVLLCATALTTEACESGQTQLRQRDTLSLIACTPSTPDECASLAGSPDARCSIDSPGNSYVCCGSTELLIQLLSGAIRPVEDATLSQTIRPFPVPFNLVEGNPTLTTLFSSLATASNNDLYSMSSTPSTMPQQTRIFSPSSIVPTTGYTLPPNMQSFTTIQPNGANGIQPNAVPTIALIATGEYRVNGNSSWQAASTVVLVQDGPCTIIVNTGLPVQKNEIIAGSQFLY
uniref:Uncharacterized protein n=1 Tax=Plectus sambesii TaxID=2011161 RepID=A0A914W3Y1_9BILA